MALSIFARLGRAIKRGLGLHMIDAQGVVTLQELHKVIDEIKALKYEVKNLGDEVQIIGDGARTGRIHAAELQDNLFNQVTNSYAAVLDVQSTVLELQSTVSELKHILRDGNDTKTQIYGLQDRIDTLVFEIDGLKSDIAGVRDVVDGLESDPVGKVAAALAEAAQNLEVR